jgi:hypothetical protein
MTRKRTMLAGKEYLQLNVGSKPRSWPVYFTFTVYLLRQGLIKNMLWILLVCMDNDVLDRQAPLATYYSITEQLKDSINAS